MYDVNIIATLLTEDPDAFDEEQIAFQKSIEDGIRQLKEPNELTQIIKKLAIDTNSTNIPRIYEITRGYLENWFKSKIPRKQPTRRAINKALITHWIDYDYEELHGIVSDMLYYDAKREAETKNPTCVSCGDRISPETSKKYDGLCYGCRNEPTGVQKLNQKHEQDRMQRSAEALTYRQRAKKGHTSGG